MRPELDDFSACNKVCNVLQTQGCKPQLQETTLSALRVLLTSCLDHAFDLPLVPGIEEGSWAATLFVFRKRLHLHSLRLASSPGALREAVLLARVPETLQPYTEVGRSCWTSDS